MARVLILGGGASGVLLALHLLRDASAGVEAAVVERRDDLGAGVAYATHHPDHLLNVRADNMSAYPDDPGHFARWLGRRPGAGPALGPEDFAPRGLYAAYLADLVAPPLGDGRLTRVRGEAAAARETDEGVEVVLADGRRLHGDAAVVATGNEGPGFPPAPWRHEGWGDPGPCRLDPEAAVAVVGTGLTMVDRVMWLLHGGHRGRITAISRHGLLPQAHRPDAAEAIPGEEVPFGAPLVEVARWLKTRARRAQAEGRGWRSTIDGLRPHTQALWAALPEAERRRFLRHGQAFWAVHRHRVAPAAAERLTAAQASGQLRVLPGRASNFVPRPGGVTVEVDRRGGGTESVEAAAVFECRGRAADVARSDNPVLRDLIVTGAARPDALGLGLDVAADCALRDARGRASARLYAMGPVTAGTFWEITAVPDIRLQASRLAQTLADQGSARQPGAPFSRWREDREPIPASRDGTRFSSR